MTVEGPIHASWMNFVLHTFFNETLSQVWYSWVCFQRFSSLFPLLINTFLRCSINCQVASWLIFRIAYLPNANCDGVYYVVVCTIECMTEIKDGIQLWPFLSVVMGDLFFVVFQMWFYLKHHK